MTSSSGLNAGHFCHQAIIVGVAVLPEVDSAMAGRAERNDEPRMVRPAIPQASYVMRLKVGRAAGCEEWRWLLAAFAIPTCSRDHVVSDAPAPIDYINGPFGSGRIVLSGIEGRRSHGCEIIANLYRDHLYSRFNCFHWAELEYYRLSNIAIPVWRIFEMECGEHHLALETIPLFQFPEEEEIAAIFPVIANSKIPTHELHITDLPFAEIFEHTIRPETVRVTMCQSFFAGDDDDYAMCSRRDDSPLLLASEAPVNVRAAIVNASTLEAPAHTNPSLVSWIISTERALVYLAGVPRNFASSEGTGAGSTLQETPNLSF